MKSHQAGTTRSKLHMRDAMFTYRTRPQNCCQRREIDSRSVPGVQIECVAHIDSRANGAFVRAKPSASLGQSAPYLCFARPARPTSAPRGGA
eukprot:3003211-Prymnesium_polylepis.1